MGNYFFYIWLALAILLFYFLIKRGKKLLQSFSDIDLGSVVFSEKHASGHIVRSRQTRRAGITKMLHVIITDQELFLKTNIALAHLANENDMLHRIPLRNILALEYEKGMVSSKLYVKFVSVLGEEKVVILQSKNNLRIKAILEQYVPLH